MRCLLAIFPFLLLCLFSELWFRLCTCLIHRGNGVSLWGDSVCAVGRCPGPVTGKLCPFLSRRPQSTSTPAPANLSPWSQVLHRLLLRAETGKVKRESHMELQFPGGHCSCCHENQTSHSPLPSKAQCGRGQRGLEGRAASPHTISVCSGSQQWGRSHLTQGETET